MDRGGSQKKRHKSVANADIISNLPDVIKDKILCCLPIKEAIRTCFLSRKWRYTWASMTELMFREDDFALGNGSEDGDSVRFASFVHTFLSLHNGPILKFEMHARRVHTFSPGGHIHRWMLILSRNGIKEIQIKTRCAAHGIVPGKLPRLLNQLTEITLELDLGNLKEANAAHCLFQIAPNLRRMELQLMHRGYSAPTSNFWDSVDHQDCLFKNLYTVVMNNFTGSCAESGFLELLLKDAPVLRSARIEDNNKLDKESLKRILKMRRASKDAEIILL